MRVSQWLRRVRIEGRGNGEGRIKGKGKERGKGLSVGYDRGKDKAIPVARSNAPGKGRG